MDLGLSGKKALVTAASQGLGREIATELVREGCEVVISSRDAEKLEQAANYIVECTGVSRSSVTAIPADVSNAEDIIQLVRRSKDTLGTIDLLVTNAGGPPGGGFDSVSDEQWQHAIDLNLMSVIRLIRETLPMMRERGGGSILNVSSISVRQPIPNLILSNTVRMATMALLKSLALEVADENIQVHNLAPGRIHTDRVEWLDHQRAQREDRSLEDVRLDEKASIPLGRYGTPKEFAKFATFLLSPANSYTTGETIFVDGGAIRSL